MQHQAGSLYYKVIKMSKILLVDDDIELTDLLAEVLRLTGFEVEVANNGQEALDKLNADDYLPKPFNDRELVARIKAILRRVGSSELDSQSDQISSKEDKTLEFDELILHPGIQQASYQGIDLSLTGSEFALLYKLALNPGQIISREELSVNVLGKNLSPFDRSIDMHMSNLRKKLPERKNGMPWLKTLRGRGYLLVCE